MHISFAFGVEPSCASPYLNGPDGRRSQWYEVKSSPDDFGEQRVPECRTCQRSLWGQNELALRRHPKPLEIRYWVRIGRGDLDSAGFILLPSGRKKARLNRAGLTLVYVDCSEDYFGPNLPPKFLISFAV